MNVFISLYNMNYIFVQVGRYINRDGNGKVVFHTPKIFVEEGKKDENKDSFNGTRKLIISTIEVY